MSAEIDDYSTLTRHELAFINDIEASQRGSSKAKVGAPNVPWTFAVRLACVRLYVLTRLPIAEIGRILDFPDIHPKDSTIRKELQRLLGPRYFWYHVPVKFPQRNLDRAGEHKEAFNGLRANWSRSSRERVEIRLRCVKDSQPTLVDILQSNNVAYVPSLSLPRARALIDKSRDSDSTSTVNRLFVQNGSRQYEPDSHNRGEPPWRPTPLMDDVAHLDESSLEKPQSSYRTPNRDRNPRLDHTQVESPLETLTFGPSNRRLYDRTSGWVDISHDVLKSRFSTESMQSLSSGEISQLRSVAQMSTSSPPRVGSSPTPAESTQFAAPGTNESRRSRLYHSLLKLYPRLMEAIMPLTDQDLAKILIEEQASRIPRREDPLWRWCCKPVEAFRWEDRSRSLDGLKPTRCSLCDLKEGHYMAASLQPIDSFSDIDKHLCAFDALDNTPLHYAATRSEAIFPTVKKLVQKVPRFKEAYVQHRNLNRQNFLFALNPTGLGECLHDLRPLLEFVSATDPLFDFGHRDVHGRTFLHSLVYHTEFITNRETVKTLRWLIKHFAIQDRADNLGRTLHRIVGTIGTIGPRRISWNLHDVFTGIWPKDPALFDTAGNTLLLQLVKSGGEMTDLDNIAVQNIRNLILSPFDWENESKVERFVQRCISMASESVHFVDRSGESALFIAVKTGQPRVVRALLQEDAKYDVENYGGISLLSAARDELLKEERRAKDASLPRICDILVCMILVMDFDAKVPLPPSSHLFRGEKADGASE